MIQVNNSEQLQKWLLESRHLGRLWDRPRFHFDPVEFAQELEIVNTQYPRFNKEEAEARAALRLLGKEEAEGRRATLIAGGGVSRAEKWLIAAIVLLAALLCIALRARAADEPESYRSELGRGYPDPQGQPGGLIVQVANQGTVLATRPAGLLQFNCSTAMSCSFSGTTFTLTSTGGGGGSPAWSSIVNPTGNLSLSHGANTTTFTWNAATGAGVNLFNFTDTANNTGTGFMFNVNLASGSAMKPAQFAVNGNGFSVGNTGLFGAVGTGGLFVGGTAHGTVIGQGAGAVATTATGNAGQVLISNGAGSDPTYQDPIVSGPDAPGVAPTKNPVQMGTFDGTNVQRLKSDTSGQPNVNVVNTPSVQDAGTSTTGAAVPAKAGYVGGNGSGNLTGYIHCDNTAVYDASTNGATQLVALVSSKKVYVCGFNFFAAGTVNVSLVYGTGSNCATGQTAITPAYQLIAQTGIVQPPAGMIGLQTIASNALCIKTSAAIAVQALVYWTQF